MEYKKIVMPIQNRIFFKNKELLKKMYSYIMVMDKIKNYKNEASKDERSLFLEQIKELYADELSVKKIYTSLPESDRLLLKAFCGVSDKIDGIGNFYLRVQKNEDKYDKYFKEFLHRHIKTLTQEILAENELFYPFTLSNIGCTNGCFKTIHEAAFRLLYGFDWNKGFYLRDEKTVETNIKRFTAICFRNCEVVISDEYMEDRKRRYSLERERKRIKEEEYSLPYNSPKCYWLEKNNITTFQSEKYPWEDNE